MMAKYLNDFPTGPLDNYRSLSTFDWKRMKLIIFGEDVIINEHNLVEYLKSDPLFETDPTTTLDETHKRNWLQLKKLQKSPLFSEYLLGFLDPGLVVRYNANWGLFYTAIKTLGSEKHQHLIDKLENIHIVGCFCLTEVGHGSNARAMQTEAHYDKTTKEFVINSPTFEAAKCWIGGLGKIATHAVIYAQLFTDGKCYGLHQFVIQIRDLETHDTLPGLTIADLGHKMGINGVDNGVMIFNRFRTSKDALLNKYVDVTDDGRYVSHYKDKGESSAASFAGLLIGRVKISSFTIAGLFKALTIAIRYSAIRKQFGPKDGNEMSILEYQTHHYRLLTYLAGGYVLRIANKVLIDDFYTRMDIKGDDYDSYVKEMHGIASASKPYSTWFTSAGMQECRESCGAHGFLSASELAELKNNNDANITYEGENNIIIQQCSRWLLKFYPIVVSGRKIDTPLKSLNFLNDFDKILNSKCLINLTCSQIDDIIIMFDWLVCYLMRRSALKFQQNLSESNDMFIANNNTQTYYMKTLSFAFWEKFAIQICYEFIRKIDDPYCRIVFEKLCKLYGLYALEKYAAYFYEGNYFDQNSSVSLIQEQILQLCAELKNEAVSLVDAIAPHDFLIKSVLGKSDGKAYDHLREYVFGRKENLNKVEWHKMILNSKL